jgi:hypothetical protein
LILNYYYNLIGTSGRLRQKRGLSILTNVSLSANFNYNINAHFTTTLNGSITTGQAGGTALLGYLGGGLISQMPNESSQNYWEFGLEFGMAYSGF